jgi:hypothetical protein
LVIVVRYLRYEHRWFLLSGAALLQVALHGLFGLTYLLAGVISVVLAAIGIALGYVVGSRTDRRSET